jgi:hypothetical protein
MSGSWGDGLVVGLGIILSLNFTYNDRQSVSVWGESQKR